MLNTEKGKKYEKKNKNNLAHNCDNSSAFGNNLCRYSYTRQRGYGRNRGRTRHCRHRERVIADTENSVGSIPPISQDENADIRVEKAEIELDIENIPRDTDPSVKNCEIEYGRKETEKIDNGE